MRTATKILAAVAILSTMSGCALMNPEGTEAYASLGIRAVHKHKESSETIASPCRGWKAVIMGCGNVLPPTPTKDEESAS